MAAERRQDNVRFFLNYYLFQDFGGQGFDVSAVSEILVGHDGRGVGVSQDDSVAFLAQHPAGLGAGIVELASLADNNRAAADD